MIDYKAVIEAAEQLYQDYKVQELYDYLVQFKDCTNDEVLWRLARATTDKGKDSTDLEVKKSCMFEAFEYAKRALQINENNFACHKVYKIDFFFSYLFVYVWKSTINEYLKKLLLIFTSDQWPSIDYDPSSRLRMKIPKLWCI